MDHVRRRISRSCFEPFQCRFLFLYFITKFLAQHFKNIIYMKENKEKKTILINEVWRHETLRDEKKKNI